MRKVRIALVGCGWISEAHVGGYRALREAGCESVEVVACCDVNEAAAKARAAQIAAFQGAEPRVFTDVGALCASGVAEAADVCLPHCFHHGVAIRLLEAGLHVQVEKPIGITVRASRAIIAAGRAAKRVVATAENTRRHVGARAAAWAVNEAKLIGAPIAAHVSFAGWMPVDLADPKWAWRSTRAMNGGGMLIDGGAHFADMAMRVFGEPVEVSCRTKQLAPATEVTLPVVGRYRTDAEDWWHAVIRFAGGAVVTWSVSMRLPGSGARAAAWHGDAGTLHDPRSWVLHPFESGGEIRTADGTAISTEELEQRYLASLDGATRERLFPLGVRDSFGIDIWDFADAIASGRRPEMDGEDGLRAKALCLACYESAHLDGAPVRYADVLAGRVDAYQRPIDERWGLVAAKAAAG